MKHLALLSILVSTLSHASSWNSDDWTKEKWEMKSKSITFMFNKSQSLRIDLDCFKNYNRCEALRATRYAKKQTNDNNFGKSPYSAVCEKSTKGKVVFLKNSKGHQSSFCLFKDKSLIDTASLYVKANK